MTEQHDTPALPPGTAARHSTAPGTSAGSVPPPVVPAALVPMSPAARTRAAVVKTVRELWLREDRLLYVLWHGKPESMAEHRAYMQSRAWVPPEMTGGAEKAVIGAGLFYHLLIGRPLLAVANALGAAAVRPLRLLALVTFVLALLVIFAVL